MHRKPCTGLATGLSDLLPLLATSVARSAFFLSNLAFFRDKLKILFYLALFLILAIPYRTISFCLQLHTIQIFLKSHLLFLRSKILATLHSGKQRTAASIQSHIDRGTIVSMYIHIVHTRGYQNRNKTSSQNYRL